MNGSKTLLKHVSLLQNLLIFEIRNLLQMMEEGKFDLAIWLSFLDPAVSACRVVTYFPLHIHQKKRLNSYIMMK